MTASELTSFLNYYSMTQTKGTAFLLNHVFPLHDLWHVYRTWDGEEGENYSGIRIKFYGLPRVGRSCAFSLVGGAYNVMLYHSRMQKLERWAACIRNDERLTPSWFDRRSDIGTCAKIENRAVRSFSLSVSRGTTPTLLSWKTISRGRAIRLPNETSDEGTSWSGYEGIVANDWNIRFSVIALGILGNFNAENEFLYTGYRLPLLPSTN